MERITIEEMDALYAHQRSQATPVIEGEKHVFRFDTGCVAEYDMLPGRITYLLLDEQEIPLSSYVAFP